jgi:hypothetical protein
MHFRLLPPEPFGSGVTIQVTPEQINFDFSNAIAALLFTWRTISMRSFECLVFPRLKSK